MILVCGHYEGIDQRFIDAYVDEEISLGDFVLTGGEIAAMAVADAVCRLIPGVLSDPECFQDESHWDGLLEYPKQTAYCIATQAGIWNRSFLRKLAEGLASIWEFERYGSFMVGGEKRPLLVTLEKEFPFVDAVHKGCWEKFGVEVCRANGIELDFSVRGLPPLKVRVREWLKGLVFAIFPWTLIVRIQNLFDIGMKERSK